jgi:hypothetical protein
VSENEIERFDGPIVAFLLEQTKILSGRRAEIADLGDSDAVNELDAVVANVNKAVTDISLAQYGRAEARERCKKWRAILPQCRDTTERFEKISQDFERSKLRLEELRSRADNEFDKLLQTRDSRPRPEQFPTDAEISAYNAREQKAATKHNEAVARVREANDKMHSLARDQWETKLALDALLFSERQLRPRDRNAEVANVGTLSAVR